MIDQDQNLRPGSSLIVLNEKGRNAHARNAPAGFSQVTSTKPMTTCWQSINVVGHICYVTSENRLPAILRTAHWHAGPTV